MLIRTCCQKPMYGSLFPFGELKRIVFGKDFIKCVWLAFPLRGIETLIRLFQINLLSMARFSPSGN